MPKKRSIAPWSILTIVVALLVGTLALPNEYSKWAPSFLRSRTLHFGLDLVGGTQLDFRISEQEIEEEIRLLTQQISELEKEGSSVEELNKARLQLQSIQDQQRTVVEAIRTVLERRINALGVSEAVITPSYIGDEKHLLVECPGVVDTQKCIETVGKTIQLEFKEEFTEATEEFEKSIEEQVNLALDRIHGSGESLQILGQDFGSQLGVLYNNEHAYFQDELPTGLEEFWNKNPGSDVSRKEGSITVRQPDENGALVDTEVPGIFLIEVTRPKTSTGRLINEAPAAFSLLQEEEDNLTYTFHEDEEFAGSDTSPVILGTLRSMQNGELKTVSLDDGSAAIVFRRSFTPGREEMEVSHILIEYQGASQASEETTRTKEEAKTLAEDLKKQIDDGANFEELAKHYSDDSSGSTGGSLGRFGRSELTPPFEEVAFKLATGEISTPVETQFGYHIIRADQAASTTSEQASFDILSVEETGALERAQAIMTRMQNGEVKKAEDVVYLRTLFFSLLPTGWKDTELDGKHFRSATVTLDPVTNIPVVQITFDDEGGRIFQELTKKNIGKRIAIFVGGDLVSAPVVQTEIGGGIAVITGSKNFDEARLLAQDLNTGAIPAPIYLAGQRTVEATLGAAALQKSVQAALIGIFILMIFMIMVYRILGFLADISLFIYAILFLAILKLPLLFFSNQYIVLTLAGMAGIILSIGMAVDANILIFERIKEEIRKGKALQTAIEIGFKRAWPSIRDGNVSTFITCIILFMIGSSIVRGFAITLVVGVALSMFTAIVITRWLIGKVAASPLGERVGLFCGNLKD